MEEPIIAAGNFAELEQAVREICKQIDLLTQHVPEEEGLEIHVMKEYKPPRLACPMLHCATSPLCLACGVMKLSLLSLSPGQPPGQPPGFHWCKEAMGTINWPLRRLRCPYGISHLIC